MGIVKIRHQEPGNLQDLSTITLGGLRKDSGEEDDYFSKLAEVDCEIAMVGDLICSAPYQLYDLPDVKEVVSLETWNSCLTEDERFSLSAYLPDMDEQTFSITMKELLNGENIFFGSPLQALFSRLKGGLYSLQVSRLRESSRLLQRQLHYRYLKSYHESMTQKLVDMKRAWSDLQPSISIEERIHIWSRRKDHKPIFLVDLNAIPPDEENVSKIPLLKKKRFMTEEVIARVATQVKAKGVLERKQIQINPVPNPILQQLPSDSLEPWRQRPKGVLKIKPKNDPLAQERQLAVHIPVEQQPLADLAGVQASRFFLPQFASKWHEETFSSQILFPHHKAMGGKAHTCLELPGLTKSQESLNVVGGLKGNSLKAQVKVRMVKDMRLHNTSDSQRCR